MFRYKRDKAFILNVVESFAPVALWMTILSAYNEQVIIFPIQAALLSA